MVMSETATSFLNISNLRSVCFSLGQTACGGQGPTTHNEFML